MIKDLVPLLQTLCWPLLVGLIFLWLHDPIKLFIRAVVRRVDEGDSFEAGSSGLKLAASLPKSPSPGKALIEKVTSGDAEFSPSVVYLLHKARPEQKLDRDGHEYYRLIVWIDSDEPDFLSKVEEVIYFLHPSFRDPVRAVSDSSDGFALKTIAWGQFLLSADVKMRDGNTSFRIERYLNF